MTRQNRTCYDEMHRNQAHTCFLRNHCSLTASTLAEILCALGLTIINLIIVSILGIIII